MRCLNHQGQLLLIGGSQLAQRVVFWSITMKLVLGYLACTYVYYSGLGLRLSKLLGCLACSTLVYHHENLYEMIALPCKRTRNGLGKTNGENEDQTGSHDFCLTGEIQQCCMRLVLFRAFKHENVFSLKKHDANPCKDRLSLSHYAIRMDVETTVGLFEFICSSME